MKTRTNKEIQCRECDGFGHIQSECANTLKKKGKSLKTTWSDKESNGSEEKDDFVNNYVAFQVTSKKDVINTVSKDVATSKTTNSNSNNVATCAKSNSEFNEDSDSDCSDEEKPSTEDIQEAYQIMYNN